MKTQLQPREWQQLSEFLDNQLTEREQADLEKRLLVRADLQAGLEELRRTRAVLRAAPHRRAPRNFTLKPEMVPARRTVWRGWTPTFSFASVATALVAVVMLLGRMLPMGASAPMMASAPESAQKELAQDVAGLTPTPMIIVWGVQPGIGGGGGAEEIYGMGGGGADPGLSAAKPMEPTPVGAPPEIVPEPYPTATPYVERVQPTPAPSIASESALAPAAEDGQADNLILGIAPQEEQGQARTPETMTVVEAERQAEPVNWQPWITGGLLLAAVLFATLAILLRRR